VGVVGMSTRFWRVWLISCCRGIWFRLGKGEGTEGGWKGEYDTRFTLLHAWDGSMAFFWGAISLLSLSYGMLMRRCFAILYLLTSRV
jgi:hypothetical protein